MKRIFMSAFALMLVTAAVHAQTDTTRGPRREWRQGQEDMYQQLNLTTDQQAKVKALREDFQKQVQDLRSQNLSEDDRRTKMQTLRQQQRTQMDAILTPDQKTQLDKLRSQRQEQMGDQRNGNDSTGRHNRQSFNNHKAGRDLQKELNLTSDQQAKIKDIRTDFKSKAQTIRNDQSLTQDQKKAKFHELMQQQQEQMKTVLTKEQQEKWQQLRSKRGNSRNNNNS